jgi:lipopolysaccharide export LptBFGC system permease protein LptF
MSKTSAPFAVVAGVVIALILVLVNRRRGMSRLLLIVTSVAGGIAVGLFIYFVKGRAQ